MRLLLSIVLLIFLVSVSCKKGKADFTLSGKITDESYNTPLSGATVKLYETVAGGSSIDLVGTSSTASDGSYSFTFPREQIETYTLIVTKHNYFEINQDISFSSLSIDDENIRNYNTTAKAWVNLRFVNNGGQSTDLLEYTKQEGKQGCIECCPITQQSLSGAVDTSIYCINDGNTNYSYYYNLIGTTNQGLKTALTIPFDTTELLLSY